MIRTDIAIGVRRLATAPPLWVSAPSKVSSGAGSWAPVAKYF